MPKNISDIIHAPKKNQIGNETENPPDFSIGAVVNPNFVPLKLQLMKMKQKIEAAELAPTVAIPALTGQL